MDFKILEFKSFNETSWNNQLKVLEGPMHNCTWNNLNYYSAYKNIKNISFTIFYENRLVALIPVGLNLNTDNIEFSFGNNLNFAPIFSKKVTTSIRKKVYTFVFEFLKKKYKLKKLKTNIQVSPIYFENEKATVSSKNQFELINFSKNYIIHNTLILDLNKNEDELFMNMSKYHRKNINKTSKIKHLNFNILNSNYKKQLIIKKFKEFKRFHRISAGKITRPKLTWEIMLKKIYDNEADLFYLTYNKKQISYLYCGRFCDFGWGWSQVNIKEYEKISPRHFLEWNAIRYYKRKNLKFYEIGERFYVQKKFIPTKKELSISDFKEKFGSDKFPKVNFKIEI